MNIKQLSLAIALTGTLAASSAFAGTVSWTDWTGSTADQATGTLQVGSTTVGVTIDNSTPFAFVQTATGGGTNYWLPNTPYLSSTVSNAPSDPGIIALDSAGETTITFSTAVLDPLIALVSWNGASVTFSNGTIEYLSSGCGYWGCGTYTNETSTSFDGSGELHGVIEVPGDVTSISFTDSVSENWHGLTVGVEGLATTSTVPEPASLSLLGLGLAGVAMLRRKKA